ncbi:MAG: hypothetical protein ACYDBB_09890 [Armatimonadota bacterium]
MHYLSLRFALLCLFMVLALPVPAAVTSTFTIREPVGLAWERDRVTYPVTFPRGQVKPDGLQLTDVAGKPVAAQLSDIAFWPDKRTVKSAVLSFMAALQANENANWSLAAGSKTVGQPQTDLAVRIGNGVIELTTSRFGIRLAAGSKTFKTPVEANALPAPIQGVRLRDGRWIGKGWWQTDRPCVGYRVEVLERGPVFARIALQYDFTDQTAYRAIVELAEGQDIATVREEFNLSAGREYEMPEQPGPQGQKYRYVLPKFTGEYGAMLWDWWGGSNGLVPSPNAYIFSFYHGMQPDSLEWFAEHPYERMSHKAAAPGDGGLKYPNDQRIISINSYYNWGQDECTALGAYNSQTPAAGEVAVMGLRPSQWVHPDLDPHPVTTLNQFVQTNNLWLERRATPDLQLRVPTCLGKRMYGIAVLERKEVMAKDAAGKKVTQKISDLPQRFIRMGRTRLDEVKDWVTVYNEPANYPQMLCKPGDLPALLKRVQDNGVTSDNDSLNPAINYLAKPNARNAQLLITGVTERSRSLLHGMLTGLDQDHNQYQMWFYNWVPNADVALGIPEITPAQRRKLLRLIAAHAYLSSSPDFHPGREQGFGWGSINMPTQMRCATALTACLVPNHPHSSVWRTDMAKYFSAEILTRTNDAGASEEVGAYGGITINTCALSLGALSRSDPKLDISAALQRFRAVALYRLQYLLPYDVRGGYRAPAPIGDSPYTKDGTMPLLWYLLAEQDPTTAAYLAWGIREDGIKPEGGWTPTSLFFDANTTATVPPFTSRLFEGAGMVMRSGFPSNEETYLNINAGGYSFGHGHPDRGCFILYAKGAPLMVDFGSQYVPNMRLTMIHPGGITFDHNETVKPSPGRNDKGSWFYGKTGGPQQLTVEPFTCLQPGTDPRATNFDEVYGRATYFNALPAADYGVTEQKLTYLLQVPYLLNDVHGTQFVEDFEGNPVPLDHPFTLTRRYLFVKSPAPDGPNYLVLHDSMPENTGHKPALNFWCLADSLEVKGPLATYTGQHGVDLDVYVAEPAQFTSVTHKVGHTNGRDFANYYTKTFGKPFKEEQILFQIPQQPGGGFFTVLLPRKHGTAAPQCTTILDGKGVRMTFPTGRVDTVIVLPQTDEVTLDGLTFHGTAFVITKENGKVTVTMPAPGTVKRGGEVLLEKVGSINL